MAKKSQYPDTYGVPITGAQVDMSGPLYIDQQGDVLVPPNDMKSVGGKMGDKGYVAPDPLDVITMFGDGTKS